MISSCLGFINSTQDAERHDAQLLLCIYHSKGLAGGARLDTDQLDTTNHSDRCLEALYCSSAVNGSCSIDLCPNGGHLGLACVYAKLFSCGEMCNLK